MCKPLSHIFSAIAGADLQSTVYQKNLKITISSNLMQRSIFGLFMNLSTWTVLLAIYHVYVYICIYTSK